MGILDLGFSHIFEVDLKNEAKPEVQNAHMGASAKYRSGTLEINSAHIPLIKTSSLGMRKITPTGFFSNYFPKFLPF